MTRMPLWLSLAGVALWGGFVGCVSSYFAGYYFAGKRIAKDLNRSWRAKALAWDAMYALLSDGAPVRKRHMDEILGYVKKESE